jgi:N4-(beta-N-acetylglucosaminyl)-L-asparaginase
MKNGISRRTFVGSTTASAVTATISSHLVPPGVAQSKGTRPVVVASANGLRATEKAMEMIRGGADTLDAVIAGVNIIEDDPKDMSVGYGGIPNADGEVELDASVMHGPSRRAGAVGGLKHIKNPSKIARLVMERTDHLMLVGDGALKFALAHGFKKEDLLTDESRAIWLRWKETMSDRDSWGPGLAAPEPPAPTSQGLGSRVSDANTELLALADDIIAQPITGTINCLAVNEKGDVSGTTTTSGLSFKLPGRVGDSPIIGCGLFVDNEVGAAGSTGRGEENIRIVGAHAVVEMMRKGMSPTDACLEACRRVSASYNNDKAKLKLFNIDFYAVNKAGEFGAAALWGYSISRRTRQKTRNRYAVNDGKENKHHEVAYLYESPDQ